MKSRKELKGRAKSKTITNALVRKLAALESPLHKSYWNTYHCCEAMFQDGNKLTSKYCNNRWCSTCNRIRTGKLIDGYEPVLKKLKNKYFVTLTIPNCTAEELEQEIKKMTRTFTRIKDVLRKQGFNLKGIRKTECTYNAEKNNYHPHFHFIISGKLESEMLQREWLKRYPQSKKIAQDIRPATDKAVKELFKYFTKLISKGTNNKFYIFALDQIFQAMRCKRVFQPFGIKKYVSEDIEELQYMLFKDIQEQNTTWEWHTDFYDWIDINSGDMLSGYELDLKTKRIIGGFR